MHHHLVTVGGVKGGTMQAVPRPSTYVALLAALALALLAALAVAPRADAFLYWTNSGSGSIGRANISGSGANPSFITGCTQPLGMAIDAGHIYWSNNATGAIGRANLDGTGVDQAFVTGVQGRVQGISVTEDYIFWVTDSAQVGRANIDGTGVNNTLFTATGESSWDIYARGSYVYWSFLDGRGVYGIHRGNLKGTSETKNILLGDQYRHILGIWVGPSYIFWGDGEDIGRAIQPTGVSPTLVGLFGMSHGLARDDDYFYSTWAGGGGLPPGIMRGRPNANSFGIIITAVSGPWDVEADTLTVSSSLRALSREIASARLPKRTADALQAKLTGARLALRSGHAGSARRYVSALIVQLRRLSGNQVPAAKAARWARALALLRFHIV